AAVHPGAREQPDGRQRVLDGVHVEDHDLGRGGLHPDRAALPGLDLLGVPPADRCGGRPVKPLDPRLLRHARATRGYLAATAVLGAAGAVLIVAQASLLATGIAAVAVGGAGPRALRGTLVALGAVVAGRALLAWAREVL